MGTINQLFYKNIDIQNINLNNEGCNICRWAAFEETDTVLKPMVEIGGKPILYGYHENLQQPWI
jgi:hypothetical protein